MQKKYPQNAPRPTRSNTERQYSRPPQMPAHKKRPLPARPVKGRARPGAFLVLVVILIVVQVGIVLSIRSCSEKEDSITVANTGASQFVDLPNNSDTTQASGVLPTPEQNRSDPEPTEEPVTVPDPSPVPLEYAKSTGQTVDLSGKIACDSGILIDVSAGAIVASFDANKRIFPASLTKVMTLITATDFISDPYKEHFTMTYDILNPLIKSGNSLAGFEVGESSPLIDYYYGLILPSGADAAEGIAVYCSGSIKAFANAMNAKAAELGLTGSHFTNPVGDQDENHYSTVHDMALILGYAFQDKLLSQVLSTYQYTTTSTDLHPQGFYFESSLQQRMKGDESGTCEVIGGKTGYTPEAGNCVVCYARSIKTGKTYLFAAAHGAALYDPIWDCIHTLADYVQ